MSRATAEARSAASAWLIATNCPERRSADHAARTLRPRTPPSSSRPRIPFPSPRKPFRFTSDRLSSALSARFPLSCDSPDAPRSTSREIGESASTRRLRRRIAKLTRGYHTFLEITRHTEPFRHQISPSLRRRVIGSAGARENRVKAPLTKVLHRATSMLRRSGRGDKNRPGRFHGRQTNRADIPAITTDIFVQKNGPQRWIRPERSRLRTTKNKRFARAP
jgi:hypothetical protein